MRIEQRQVTTVDFLEPKPRQVAVCEEGGLHCVRVTARDEQCEMRFSTADFARFRHAVARSDWSQVWTESETMRPSAVHAVHSPVRESDPIRVEQRLITVVDLCNGKLHEFTVSKDSWGCKISGVCQGEMVQMLMSVEDFHRLRCAVRGEAPMAMQMPVAEMRNPVPVAAFGEQQYVTQSSEKEWLAYN